MTTYIWSATDKSGQTVIKEIEAETAEDSQYILLAQGYSDLVLKAEDVMAAAKAGFGRNPTVLGEEIKISAQDWVKQMDNPVDGFWKILWQGISQNLGSSLLLLFFIGYNLYRGNHLTVWLLVAALVCWVAFILCVSLPLALYNKLIKAVDWYRWNEVLSTIQTIKRVQKIHFIKIPATELVRNRCKALAGMGHLDQALTQFEPCRGRPDCPEWLYLLFLSSLHTLVKKYDRAIDYNLQAIAIKPDSVGYSDLANRYARYLKDPAKAQAAMDEAAKTPVPEIAKPFRIRCQGIIEYLKGDLASARKNLETAIDLVEKAKGRPFRDGHLAVARAYLACVLAKQGDLPAAKNAFALAKSYLVATGEDDLLAECRKLQCE